MCTKTQTNKFREENVALKRILTVTGACLMLLSAFTGPSFAEQWPSRTVHVVVPYGAGGVTDTMARLTADRLGKIFHQTFVVENKPGAGGAIGVSYAMHAAQDGYTILFVGSTLFTVLPLARDVNYVPLKDLVPVSITGTNGMVMVVNKDEPYSTFREFVDYVKANPGKVTYASGGVATNNHLDTAYLAGMEKLNMVHVPFTGGQAALAAVLGKSVDMHFGNSSDLIEPVKNGLVKAIAVSTPKRMPQLPNVPAVAETIPGFEYIAWNGYAVTGGVPHEVIARLEQALQTIAKDAEVIKVFSNLGIDSVGSTQAQALQSLKKDMPVYSQMVDMAGVRKK
jgi:tripartite-type tricarboxylate transporter receptor subunit TctC